MMWQYRCISIFLGGFNRSVIFNSYRNMFRIVFIPFLSALVALLLVESIQGFTVPKAGNSIHRRSRHISNIQPPLSQSVGIATKNTYQKYDSISGIYQTAPLRCDTTLNAFVDVSSVSESSVMLLSDTTIDSTQSLWLSQLLPSLPQIPVPPTPTTIDPTTILSDIFRTVLGTPLILAIPIVAALGVATLIAYLIVSYASPAEEE